jgi:diguanylate cyclase (GGDEF)-like protein
MHPVDPRAARPPRLLLIEAETAVRSALHRELASSGIEVIDAADSATGIAHLDGQVDLALLGRCADGMSTRTVLERVHARSGPSRPLCIVLVRDDDTDSLSCLREGADDFLSWPAAPGHATERVRLVLAGTRRGRRSGTPASPGKLTDEVADSELPGVLGRQGFMQHLGRCLSQAHGLEGHVAVLCIDLTQLKVLTGALTHEVGNDLLAQIVTRLREGLRRDDLFGLLVSEESDTHFARLRSDELTLLLPRLRRPADALEIGRRLLQLLDEPFLADGREVFVTVSVGVASSPTDGVQADDLLKHAETATLCARQQGRHTVLAYTPTMDARAFERLTLETGLRRALDRNELVVHYQPRVEVATSKIIGLEALVRWRHPDQGLVSPAQFISLAEETGLIVPIGAWVLRQACEQSRAWQQAGIPPVRVSVNISSVQFRQPNLHDVVMDTLAETGLDPSWLELELTESLLMQNPEDVVVLLERLSGRGVHLSIDDFGTGYSSLSYLRRFPIDSLKIDRTFIRELTTNPDDAAIATSIILMGKALRLNVVAEGVETRSQLSFLRVMKCQEAQGYLFSPPLPVADVERLLRQGGVLLEEAA